MKDIKTLRNWFNRHHRYKPEEDVYFYTLTSLSAYGIKKMMVEEIKKYPAFTVRQKLLERIAPSSYKTNLRQRFKYITQDDVDNPKIIPLILFIISYILRARSSNRKLYDRRTGEVRLCNKTLLDTCNDSNLAYWAVKIAVHLKIIEIVRQYSTEEGRCRSYRICPEHLCDPSNFIIKERCSDSTIADNVRDYRSGLTFLKKRAKNAAKAKTTERNHQTPEQKRESRLDMIYKQPILLFSLYYLDKLKVHRQEAMDYLKDLKNSQIQSLDAASPAYSFNLSNIYMKSLSSAAAVNRIDEEDKFITRDDYGRIHTNLTNFPRILRQFLYFEDSTPLYQVDLSNSQPLLIAELFPQYFYENYGKRINTVPKLDKFCSKNGFSDVPKYVTLVVNGALYPELFRMFHNLGVPFERKLTPDEKDMIKENFYLLLFGRDMDIERISAFKDAFAAEFPTIWALIMHFKPEGHHAHLAHMLQKAESAIFIDKVLYPLLVKEQKPFVLSIHDSIVCQENLIQNVQTKIADAFARAKFKFDYVTLKIEGLNEKDTSQNETVRLKIQKA